MDISSDSYTEYLIFFYVIKSYEMASIYKSHYFAQDRLRKLFDIIQPYMIQYHEEPSEQQVMELLMSNGMNTDLTGDIIHSIWEIRKQITQYSDEWLKSTAKGYAEWKILPPSILTVIFLS